MYFAKNSLSGFIVGLLLCSMPLLAKDACDLPPLAGQHKDIATVQHLEDEWTLAFLRSDTDLERCLLSPDFTEIKRTGEVTFLSDELELAAKNRGKNLAIPNLPKAKILLHDDVAVAYGISTSGKIRYSDSYFWKNGAWHVFFAQQTQLENNSGNAPGAGNP